MGARLVTMAVVGPLAVGLYCLLNRWPVFAPRMLPLTAVDQATPFLLWTVWPYAAINVSNAVMPFFIRERRNFRQMLLTLGIGLGISALFWLLWPVAYPRPPLPADESATAALYRFLVQVDQPLNCLPSGHIVVPGAQLIFVAREHPRLKAALWLVFGVASLSILTTKQHYAWDAVLAVAVLWVAFKLGEWLTGRAGAS